MALGPRRRARQWLMTLSIAAACALAVAAATRDSARDEADTWTALVQAADRGSPIHPPGAAPGTRLSAWQAYLLAFHEAQDAADVEHVLAAADRLDAVGRADLAARARRAADAILRKIGGQLLLPPPASG